MLALTGAILWLWVLCEPSALVSVHQVRVCVQTLRHLVADDVHQPLKHSLDINVLLGRGLVELETQLVCELFTSLVGDDSLVLHVALVPHQDHLGVVPRVRLDLRAPVLDAVEGFFVSDVVHEDEAHGAPVVGCGDGPVPLLSGCVPNLQLHSFVVPEDRLDLEVNADGADEGRGEGVVSVAEEEGGLAHRRVADDEKFKHVVEVLVGGIFLPAVVL